MKTISGTMQASESGDDSICVPTDAEGYLVAANAMLSGARTLGKTTPVSNFALTLLCGYASECALKAMLSQSGVHTNKLKSPALGHQLIKLWSIAVEKGIDLPTSPQQWIEHINRVHAAPHHLRYPLGLHAMVLPNQESMLDGVEQLCSIANACVK